MIIEGTKYKTGFKSKEQFNKETETMDRRPNRKKIIFGIQETYKKNGLSVSNRDWV